MRQWIKIVEGLLEAPVGDISFLGGDEPASLRASDIAVAKNPKSHAKIRRILDKAPVMINIAFLNHSLEYHSPGGIGNPEREVITPKGNMRGSGTMTPEQFEQTYGHVMQADPEALTVVFGMNEGDDTRPLSPWIIAHRIGHALQEQGATLSGGVMTPVLGWMNTIVQEIPWNYESYTANFDDLAHAVGTWKSARDKMHTSDGEFVLEAFAQYLIKGHIILNKIENDRFPRAMSLNAKRRYPTMMDTDGKEIVLKPGGGEIVNAKMEEWRVRTEKWFRGALTDAVGKIIVL